MNSYSMKTNVKNVCKNTADKRKIEDVTCNHVSKKMKIKQSSEDCFIQKDLHGTHGILSIVVSHLNEKHCLFQKIFKKKHAIINVKNDDYLCFLYSILAITNAEHIHNHRGRV